MQASPSYTGKLDLDLLSYDTRASFIHRATELAALQSRFFFVFFTNKKGALDFYRRRSEPPRRGGQGAHDTQTLETFFAFRHDHMVFCLFLFFSISLLFIVTSITKFVQVRHSLYITLQPLGF